MVPPRQHFVFLLDGSDSFTQSIQTGSDTFIESKNFVENFIREVPFKLRGATTKVSLIIFSGIKSFVKSYKPGTNGEVDPKAPDFRHYKIILDGVDINDCIIDDYTNRINNADQPDGNGAIYLALQDITLESFWLDSEAEKYCIHCIILI